MSRVKVVKMADKGEEMEPFGAKKAVMYGIFAATEVVGLLCLILVIVWMEEYYGGYAWDGTTLQFNYHPTFMILGMLLLYGNTILIYRICSPVRPLSTLQQFRLSISVKSIHILTLF